MELTSHAYILYYGIPILIFLSIVLITLRNNSNAIEYRLLASSFFLYMILFIIEWYRHHVPLNHSPFIITWLIGPIMLTSLLFTVHVCLLLYEKHTKLKIPFPKGLIYVTLLLQVIIALSPIAPQVSNFTVEGIWIRRDAPLYNLWITSFVFIAMLANLILCYIGYKKSKNKNGTRLFSYLVSIIPINLLLILVIVVITPEKFIPSIPSFYIMVTLSLFILVGMMRYKIFPQYEQRYVTMFQRSPISIIILTEACDILEANDQAKKYFLEDVTGQNFHIMMEKSDNVNNVMPLFNALRDKPEVTQMYLTMNHFYTKEPVHFIVNAIVMEENDERFFYIMFRDRTIEVKQENEIRYLAYYDSLTNLPNRAAFMNQVESAFSMHKDIAIVLIDLNDFKLVNDTYGHAAGDQLLIATGEVLKELAGAYHFPARLGGDEFVLFIDIAKLEGSLDEFIHYLKLSFEHKGVTYDGYTLKIKPSIGYALKQPDDSLQQLLHRADQHMYIQKELYKKTSGR